MKEGHEGCPTTVTTRELSPEFLETADRRFNLTCDAGEEGGTVKEPTREGRRRVANEGTDCGVGGAA